MRILMLSGTADPTGPRQAALLADAPDVDLLHVVPAGEGRRAGQAPSASGKKHYMVGVAPIAGVGLLPLRGFKPDLIHLSADAPADRGLVLRTLLTRALAARGRPLVLRAWADGHANAAQRPGWQRRWALRSAAHVVCANAAGVRTVQAEGYAGPTSVCYPYALDRRQWRPHDASGLRKTLRLKGFTVGVAGRLAPELGVDVLLRAAAAQTTPPTLLVVGEGPALPEWQALARDLGIGARVRFVGQQPHAEMPAYLAACDVMALPARASPFGRGPSGRVLAEAMACGVPVVAARVGDLPEVVGEAGETFAEGDHAALGQLLAGLAAGASRRRALAEAAYRRALKHFTVERLAAQTYDLWCRLLAAPAGD